MGVSDADARVVRAVDGDRDELEALIREVEPDLRAVLSIQPLWRRSLDPEDVLQVSYLEAFLRIGSLRDPSLAGFRAWMRRLVQNDLRDAIRALERDRRPDARQRLTHGAGGESARTLFARMISDTTLASGPAVLQEDVARLHDAITCLPASYRHVVQRMDLDEVDVDVVAEELDRSRGAVHLLRSRAHDRLRELLRP